MARRSAVVMLSWHEWVHRYCSPPSSLEEGAQVAFFVLGLLMIAYRVLVLVVVFGGSEKYPSKTDEQSAGSHLIWVPPTTLSALGQCEGVAASH